MGLLLLEVLLLELLERRHHHRRARKLERERGRAWAEGVLSGYGLSTSEYAQLLELDREMAAERRATRGE